MNITELSKILGESYSNINKAILLEMLESEQSQGFDIYKLEKDFYLTILLILISRAHPELIFKGGTCLNKIYFDYYRLSEDLDFVLISDGGRKVRQNLLESCKQSFSKIFANIGFHIIDKRTKFNEHKQGIFEFEYKSIIDSSTQTVKVDIRIESNLQKDPINKNIIAIYQDPISNQPFFRDHTIKVMDLDEIFAEKTRAALTRIEPAIRDFFDIHYAKQKGFDFGSIKRLIDQKVAEVEYKYTIDDIFEILNKQIKTELDPVLKNDVDYSFNLKEIYDYVLSFKH